MPHFVITDVNSSYNKGDAAIVIGMLKILRKSYPESEISVLSLTPNEDRKYYSKYGAKTYDRLFNYYTRKVNRILLIPEYLVKMFLYLLWTRMDFIPVGKNARMILSIYRSADLVISCGGGTLGGNIIVSMTKSLFPIYLAKKLGKKVLLSAQSIEPFSSNIIKFLTRFVLNRIDIITVREKYSLELLKSLGIKGPVYLKADTAFLVDAESLDSGYSLLNEAGVPRNDKLRVGVTVRDWMFPHESRRIKKVQYLSAVTTAVERIIEETGAMVIFFPNVIFGPHEDDRILSFQIKGRVRKPSSDNIFVLTKNYSPEQLKAMIGTMDIFVGTRIHSIIFAVSMNVPSAAIAYQRKHYGIMEMVGLEDYVLDISDIDADKLTTLVQKLKNNRDAIIKRVKEKISIVQDEAMRNGEFIEVLLNKNPRK